MDNNSLDNNSRSLSIPQVRNTHDQIPIPKEIYAGVISDKVNKYARENKIPLNQKTRAIIIGIIEQALYKGFELQPNLAEGLSTFKQNTIINRMYSAINLGIEFRHNHLNELTRRLESFSKEILVHEQLVDPEILYRFKHDNFLQGTELLDNYTNLEILSSQISIKTSILEYITEKLLPAQYQYNIVTLKKEEDRIQARALVVRSILVEWILNFITSGDNYNFMFFSDSDIDDLVRLFSSLDEDNVNAIMKFIETQIINNFPELEDADIDITLELAESYINQIREVVINWLKRSSLQNYNEAHNDPKVLYDYLRSKRHFFGNLLLIESNSIRNNYALSLDELKYGDKAYSAWSDAQFLGGFAIPSLKSLIIIQNLFRGKVTQPDEIAKKQQIDKAIEAWKLYIHLQKGEEIINEVLEELKALEDINESIKEEIKGFEEYDVKLQNFRLEVNKIQEIINSLRIKDIDLKNLLKIKAELIALITSIENFFHENEEQEKKYFRIVPLNYSIKDLVRQFERKLEAFIEAKLKYRSENDLQFIQNYSLNLWLQSKVKSIIAEDFADNLSAITLDRKELEFRIVILGLPAFLIQYNLDRTGMRLNSFKNKLEKFNYAIQEQKALSLLFEDKDEYAPGDLSLIRSFLRKEILDKKIESGGIVGRYNSFRRNLETRASLLDLFFKPIKEYESVEELEQHLEELKVLGSEVETFNSANEINISNFLPERLLTYLFDENNSQEVQNAISKSRALSMNARIPFIIHTNNIKKALGLYEDSIGLNQKDYASLHHFFLLELKSRIQTTEAFIRNLKNVNNISLYLSFLEKALKSSDIQDIKKILLLDEANLSESVQMQNIYLGKLQINDNYTNVTTIKILTDFVKSYKSRGIRTRIYDRNKFPQYVGMVQDYITSFFERYNSGDTEVGEGTMVNFYRSLMDIFKIKSPLIPDFEAMSKVTIQDFIEILKKRLIYIDAMMNYDNTLKNIDLLENYMRTNKASRLRVRELEKYNRLKIKLANTTYDVQNAEPDFVKSMQDLGLAIPEDEFKEIIGGNDTTDTYSEQ